MRNKLISVLVAGVCFGAGIMDMAFAVALNSPYPFAVGVVGLFGGFCVIVWSTLPSDWRR